MSEVTPGTQAHPATHGGTLAHPAHLAHHFDTPEQQRSAAKLGMWLFLLTEILLFSGLFTAYAAFHTMQPKAFHIGSKELDVVLGTINTVVLICSSLTMALGVHAAQRGHSRATVGFLVTTILLAGVFLVIKYFEYHHKFELGLGPGMFYHPHPEAHIPADQPHVRTFFSVYFMLTGLHGIHVIAGMLAIAWIAFRAARRQFSAAYNTPVELVGLYWHLVDLIWIYLFPLLYLIG